MKPDDPLLKILACPLDKGPLTLLPDRDALLNPRLQLRYPVVDGIPQLLPSSGVRITADGPEPRDAAARTADGPQPPDGTARTEAVSGPRDGTAGE
ncbi:Trm112 family protein [Streptomyces zhihengii]|uniref:Trm112 family protein n=1 Tax=Streptomyces zhihengii TaxID=1818004 RepID=UPI001FD12E0F|nr:Trm112 family protein [Streptomyces zhihengii]